MKLWTTLLAGVAAAAFATQVAAQEEIVFGISAATGSLQQRTAAEFTKRANEKLGDKAVVKLFDSSQLGKDQEMLQKLKLGTLQISLPSSIMSSISDQFALFDMPFLVADRDHMGRIEAEIFWPDIAPTVEGNGYKVLAVWENGVRHISNNERPINTPADLEGIKIRTPKSTWRVKMFEEYGANPTPMAFSEVFTALQTGVIDGQENPYTNIEAAKLNEVQKYLSKTGHVYSPAYPTMGKRTYDNMDPEIRDVLEQTAREMEAWAREQGAADDEALEKELVDGGMEFNVADRAAFVEASKPVYAAFAEEVDGGQDMIDRAIGLANGS
ncbi:TRAP transporter substrate-binding protein [Acuticoccus sp. MNP-M23]|uniref:TRAP transporter substrate-binding protein n=1 Tax=Acuticoccus sp. MNP-M23 TaxID=3072793 RepID=UPI0028151BF4|nr:TRAP transporter substrate-binding protein [Acuticoccus sp. MNP-M23]WMS42824.1 TRAP transporter substrate-binding protein [Acuticoccus sp. MNP-M23]